MWFSGFISIRKCESDNSFGGVWTVPELEQTWIAQQNSKSGLDAGFVKNVGVDRGCISFGRLRTTLCRMGQYTMWRSALPETGK